MCDAGFVKFVDAFRDLGEHIPDKGVVLVLTLIQEIEQLNTIQKFHDKETDFFLYSLRVCPGSWFLEI